LVAPQINTNLVKAIVEQVNIVCFINAPKLKFEPVSFGLAYHVNDMPGVGRGITNRAEHGAVIQPGVTADNYFFGIWLAADIFKVFQLLAINVDSIVLSKRVALQQGIIYRVVSKVCEINKVGKLYALPIHAQTVKKHYRENEQELPHDKSEWLFKYTFLKAGNQKVSARKKGLNLLICNIVPI
jgi:hypothetical protein